MAIEQFRRKSNVDPAIAEESKLCEQIRRLRDASESRKIRLYGENWAKKMREFYMMVEGDDQILPSFRPLVQVPELQTIILNEAADLSDSVPKIYLTKGDHRQREEEVEKGLQAQWTEGAYNIQLMYASLWSELWGTSFVQVGFEPNASEGKGEVWIEACDPSTVFPDPNAKMDKDCTYWIKEDKMYLDAIEARWPEQAGRIKLKRTGPAAGPGNMRFPPGPMRKVLNFFSSGRGTAIDEESDGRFIVRTCYVRDASVMENPKETKEDDPLAQPKYVPRFPGGRMIVECEGIILFDGENPVPKGLFPFVSCFGLPAIYGIFAPPPVKFTLGLQDLAQRMLSQVYENACRLNNGVWVIDQASEINTEDFGGMPAEIVEYATSGKPPEVKYPPPMPQQMTDLPDRLLDKQRKIQGYTEARQGNAPAGNVSAPLYDNAITQSQAMTRLRARMFAESIRSIAELVFLLMAKYFSSERFFSYVGPEGVDGYHWKGQIEDYEKFKVFVDPGSVKPMSSAALRNLVPVLKQLGLIDPETALEWLQVPGADKIKERLEAAAATAAQQQMQLKAAGIKTGKK